MKKAMISLAGIWLLAAGVQAQPVTFTVAGGAGNLVRFESKAPLETVVGTTNRVSGTITLDPQNLSAGITASISVDAASLDTGNKIRDSHMRENHLQTAKYPVIKFTLNNVPLEGSLTADKAQAYNLPGDFYLHGVTRTITVPVTVIYSESPTEKKIRVKGNFKVNLSDYQIPRPQFLVMKLDEVQNITIDFWGVVK